MANIINFQTIKKTSSLPLVIGFFDGLHKGHLNLFKSLEKNKFNILTFINVPNKSNNLLYTDAERIADLQELKPANIFLLDLHKHNLLAMAFVYKLLNKLKPKCIVVGEDFKFGNARHGNIKQLKHYFNVKAVRINKKYKTTNIKQHIINGNVLSANKLLVDPYMITGIVQRGKQLGRKLGYPTANINLPKNTIQPKMGSYKAYTYVNGIKYQSAVFIRNYLLETHIFNFNKNIYGKVISIQLIQYHRVMNKVNNFTSLQKVIDSKVKSIKSTF